jgi:carbonic anhydrase
LPENLVEFFGTFGSERQNVIKSCEIARGSPLMPGKIPVHGFLVDIQTGKLEWIVNGYQNWNTMSDRWNEVAKSAGQTADALKNLGDFQIGEMKFPETKIGETLIQAGDWLSQKIGQIEIKPPESLKPPMISETAADIARKIVKTASKPLPSSAATEENSPRRPAPPRITPQSPPFRPRMIIRRKGK